MTDEIEKLADNVKATFENMQRTWTEFQRSQKEAHNEFLKKGDIDPLLAESRRKMAEDLVKHQEALDKRFDQVQAAFQRTSLGKAVADGDEMKQAEMFFTSVKSRRGELKQGQKIDPAQVDLEGYRSYKAAFEQYVRRDDRAMTPDQYKSLSVGSDPDGGYTVTPELAARIIVRQFESSPIRQLASVETISTMSLDILEDTNDATANWVAETQSITTADSTPQLGKRNIPVHELQAMPAATQALLDDSMIDIEAWMARKLADKFTRSEANAFAVGNGVGKPRGMTTYSNGTTWGTIEQVNSGANGGVTYAGLVNVMSSLKEFYLPNATWLLRRELVGKVLALTGADTPLWIPSIERGQPATLLGYPVRYAQDLASLGTGSLSGVFGDFRAGYTIVDRVGMRVLRDPYSSKPFVLFYTTKRVGGDVTDFDALKLVNLAA